MDKFVIRKEREPRPRRANEAQQHRLVQTTIQSLKKVVPIEEMNSLARTLELNWEKPHVLSESLRRIKQKVVEPSVLMQLKLGKAVKKLCSHSDPNVSATAKALVDEWTAKILSPPKPTLEVKAGGKDETYRRAFRTMIASALHRHVALLADAVLDKDECCEAVALTVEKHIFKTEQALRPTPTYKRHCRHVAHAFMHNPEFAVQALRRQLEPTSIVSSAITWARTGSLGGVKTD
eukprot:m.74043 g.74043  ORF g.74043 m.74043 type:complete len:235 (+) comp13924_c1_seq3:201-905(+)